MTNTVTVATKEYDLVDVIDLQPLVGEYVGCKETSSFDVFGVHVEKAFHRYHAMRIAVSNRWGGKCEYCNHRLRYSHIVQDTDGEYHCYGHTCLCVVHFGEEGTRRLEMSQRIEQKTKSNAFCATFNVPSQFWDLPREQRPTYARPWKGVAASSRGRRPVPQWKLSVWGNSFEECLDNCMSLWRLLGVKLT